MSGVYIPGMGIPKTGYRQLFLTAEGEVVYYPGSLKDGELRFPVIHVSDHGRLVDADEFIKANEKAYDLFKNGDEISTDEATISYSYASYLINTAPTIIPAEEGE